MHPVVQCDEMGTVPLHISPNHKKTSESQNLRPVYKIPDQSSKVSRETEAEPF